MDMGKIRGKFLFGRRTNAKLGFDVKDLLIARWLSVFESRELKGFFEMMSSRSSITRT